MTDRELLELAARAAGIVGEYVPAGIIHNVDHGEGTYVWYEHILYSKGKWNPLINDGDALRLVVKLKIDVMPEVYGLHRCDTRNSHGEYFTEQATMGYSIEEATRRAIVRAAAEIGKGMK